VPGGQSHSLSFIILPNSQKISLLTEVIVFLVVGHAIVVFIASLSRKLRNSFASFTFATEQESLLNIGDKQLTFAWKLRITDSSGDPLHIDPSPLDSHIAQDTHRRTSQNHQPRGDVPQNSLRVNRPRVPCLLCTASGVQINPAYHAATEEGTTCLNPTISDQYLTRLENTTPPRVPFIIRRATKTGPNPEVQHTAEGEPIPLVIDHRQPHSPPPRQRVEPGHLSLYCTQTLVRSLSLTEIDTYPIGGNIHLTSSSEESVVTQTYPEEHIPSSGLTPAFQTALARRVVEDNTSDRYHRISTTPGEQDWPTQDQATWEGHLPSTPSPCYSRASS
jgi:hypothetical protein